MSKYIDLLGDAPLLLCSPLNFSDDAFFAVLVVVVILIFSFIRLIFGDHTSQSKRRLLRVNAMIFGIVFMMPFYLLGSSSLEKIIVGPAVFSIILFNLWAIRVCDHCAHLNRSSSILKPAQYCQNCGEPLK